MATTNVTYALTKMVRSVFTTSLCKCRGRFKKMAYQNTPSKTLPSNFGDMQVKSIPSYLSKFQYHLFVTIYFQFQSYPCRFHCKYGPQDDNGYLQKISPLLLPKQKVKISMMKVSLSDEASMSLLKKKRGKGVTQQITIV